MTYLTVGTSELLQEKFVNIEDSAANNMKPMGGLWLTVHEYDTYNEWVDYLLGERGISTLYAKGSIFGYSPWRMPCVALTLKEDAKIFILDSKAKLDALREKHPLDNDKFSYEAISKIYDGIFVDLRKLLRELKGDLAVRMNKFDVNTLILFNLKCIDSYQSGIVEVDNESYEANPNEALFYEIKLDDKKKKVYEKH